MSKLCCIVGAAPGVMPALPECALVIAADGGYDKLIAAGRLPDAAVGDFDSVRTAPKCSCIRLPREKDVTDTAAAVAEGLRRGCDEFEIYCGLGGRLDHTIANIQLLLQLRRQGISAALCGENERIFVLKDDKVRFDEHCRGRVSVFSLSECSQGVCERGLKYPLDGYTLANDNHIGVSNEFVGVDAEISVEKGELLVMLYYIDTITK